MVPAAMQIHGLLAEATSVALYEDGTLLDELLRVANLLDKPIRIAEYLALQARLFEQQHAHEKAANALKAAVTLAEPRGIVRSLADADSGLTPLVTASARAELSPYLVQLLHALRMQSTDWPASHVSQAADAAIRLTRRERDLLCLLMAHRTDREIAEQLVISPLTVRTHIEHISEKLGVHGRRAIAACAASLNLLG